MATVQGKGPNGEELPTKPAWSVGLTAYTISHRKFRQPQLFRVALTEDGLWAAQGPFGVQVFSDKEEDLQEELDNCLAMLWETYAEGDDSALTGDALDLRRELLAAVE